MILVFVLTAVKINHLTSRKTGAEQKVQEAFTFAKTANQNRMPLQALSQGNKFIWELSPQSERQKTHSKIMSTIPSMALI